MKVDVKLNPGQVALIFTPVEERGEWTGEVHTGLLLSEEGDPESMSFAMDMAITMSAAGLFLEDNPEYEDDFDEIKAAILEEMFPEQYAAAKREYDEQEGDGYEVKDNVITLNKWTKTRGSA